MTYQRVTDEAHTILRKRVWRILESPSETQEDRDWKRMALTDAYTAYGKEADKVRGVQ
jgi:hypothetical protein